MQKVSVDMSCTTAACREYACRSFTLCVRVGKHQAALLAAPLLIMLLGCM